MITNISHGPCKGSDCVKRSVSLISLLFTCCCPLAVSWFIIAIIVQSFNAQTIRALTHVFQEVGKDQPSITYFNASSTVFVKPFEFWIGATPDHSTPDAVGPGEGRASTGVSVLNTSLFGTRSAGHSLSFGQVDTPNAFLYSALAFAENGFDRITGSCDERIGLGYDGEEAEDFSDPVLGMDQIRTFLGDYWRNERFWWLIGDVGQSGFKALASTGCGMTREQFLILCYDLFSAGAFAAHHAYGFSVGTKVRWCIPKNCELAECETDGVNCGRHMTVTFSYVFSVPDQLHTDLERVYFDGKCGCGQSNLILAACC